MSIMRQSTTQYKALLLVFLLVMESITSYFGYDKNDKITCLITDTEIYCRD
jgi:hypothetical protein